MKLGCPRPSQLDSEKEPTVATGNDRLNFKPSGTTAERCLNYVRHLRTKVNMNYIYRLNAHFVVNTLRLGYKNQSVNVV